MLVGIYERFPQKVHAATSFSVSTSTRALQLMLMQTLCKLNKQAPDLKDIADPSLSQYCIIFEFGFAEANDFIYLNDEETGKLLKIINKEVFRCADFLVVIRYYKSHAGKKRPLRFDYYLLRFTFSKKSVMVSVFHERGPMRIIPEELVNLVVGSVNTNFSKRMVKPLAIS